MPLDTLEPETLESIFSFLDANTLAILSGVCRHVRAVARYVGERRSSMPWQLKRYMRDVSAFTNLLVASDACVTGSTVAACLLGEQWANGDLDIACGCERAFVGNVAECCMGMTSRPDRRRMVAASLYAVAGHWLDAESWFITEAGPNWHIQNTDIQNVDRALELLRRLKNECALVNHLCAHEGYTVQTVSDRYYIEPDNTIERWRTKLIKNDDTTKSVDVMHCVCTTWIRRYLYATGARDWTRPVLNINKPHIPYMHAQYPLWLVKYHGAMIVTQFHTLALRLFWIQGDQFYAQSPALLKHRIFVVNRSFTRSTATRMATILEKYGERGFRYIVSSEGIRMYCTGQSQHEPARHLKAVKSVLSQNNGMIFLCKTVSEHGELLCLHQEDYTIPLYLLHTKQYTMNSACIDGVSASLMGPPDWFNKQRACLDQLKYDPVHVYDGTAGTSDSVHLCHLKLATGPVGNLGNYCINDPQDIVHFKKMAEHEIIEAQWINSESEEYTTLDMISSGRGFVRVYDVPPLKIRIVSVYINHKHPFRLKFGNSFFLTAPRFSSRK